MKKTCTFQDIKNMLIECANVNDEITPDSVLKTDSQGYAESGMLAYGTYEIRQTSQRRPVQYHLPGHHRPPRCGAADGPCPPGTVASLRTHFDGRRSSY